MSKKRKTDERVYGKDKKIEIVKEKPEQKPQKNINKITLQAKTPNQKEVLKSLWQNRITFVTGPAGAGKTYLASTYGLMELMKGKYERLVITRPCVEAYGESLGFLPGTVLDKAGQYICQVLDVFGEHVDTKVINKFIEDEQIQIVPLAFMRGRSFKNTFIIGEEFQNSQVSQMMLFLTRLGENSKMAITGDLTQSDLQNDMNGLKDAVVRFKDTEGIGIINLTREDIVRDPMVQIIVDKYEEKENKENKEELPI